MTAIRNDKNLILVVFLYCLRYDLRKGNTYDKFLKASFLTTNTNGEVTLNEQFVASNVISIAQSKYMPAMKTKAIYEDEEMVGFVIL